MGSTRSLHARLGHHFAACATVTAAIAQHASAEVISWELNQVVPPTLDGLYVDVALGLYQEAAFAGWDLNPWGSTSLLFFWPTTTGNAAAGVRLNTTAGGTTPGTTLANLPYGFQIGPALVGGASGASFGTSNPSFTTANQGRWNFNAINYFGFRFTDASAQVRYGYGVMQVGATAVERTLISVHFEDSGGPITIPFPSGPYDPCAATNPTLVSGSNSVFVADNAPDLVIPGMTIRKANYYKFTPTADGTFTFGTCTSGAATRMAVLTDCTPGATVLASNDNGCGAGSQSSSLAAEMFTGVPVYVVVGGESADIPSPIAISVTPPPLPACVTAAVAVYGDNEISSTANAGVNQIVASNAAQTTVSTIYNCQWFRFTPVATGAFTFKTCEAGDTKLAIGTACPGAGATFATIAYNDDAPGCPTGGGFTSEFGSWIDATNNGAAGSFPLTQSLVAGTTYYICVGGFGTGTEVNGFLNISGPDGSPYDPCSTSNPTVAAGANVKPYRTDTVANLDACGTSITAANYYKFTATLDGIHTFTACPSTGTARLAVLDGCAPGSTVLGCGTAACGTGSGSSAAIALTTGTDVYVVVGGSGLPAELSISVALPPNEACVDGTIATYGDNPIVAPPLTGPDQVVFTNAAQNTTTTIYNAQWLKFTPTATGSFSFETCNAGDTKLAIGTACVGVTQTFSTIAYDDDTCETGGTATTFYASKISTTDGDLPLTQDLVAGQTYYICVGCFNAGCTFGQVDGNLVITGPEAPACPADLNNNGIVNGDDLGILLTAWGPCPTSGSCPADLNNNGIVNGDDLGILLTAWGACPN